MQHEERLNGVNADLAALFREVWKRHPHFGIAEGLRTQARQRQLVASGASTTLKSRHLVGQAVDVACFDTAGTYLKTLQPYAAVNAVVQQVAKERGLRITWGGSWKTFRDGPHFQIEL